MEKIPLILCLVVCTFAIAISAVADAARAQGESLIVYLTMDENSGSIARDSSAYGNNGNLINFDFNATSEWITDCKLGSCLNFDGVNDYVEISDSPSLDVGNFLTMEAWIYPKQLKQASIISRKSSGGTVRYGIIMSADSRLSSFLGLTGGDLYSSVVRAIDANQWHHVALTWNGSHALLYLNGVVADVETGSGGVIAGNRPVFVGSDNGTSNYFNGIIDEVKIYNRTLSSEEIKSDYDRGHVQLNSIYGAVKDNNGTALQTTIVLYNTGTDTVNVSGATENDGTYNLQAKSGSYDIQYNIPNSAFSNLYIKMLSMSVNSDLLDQISYVSVQDPSRLSFATNNPKDIVFQIYSEKKPERVSADGVLLTEVTSMPSLFSLAVDTWFYDSSGKILYVRIYPEKELSWLRDLRGFGLWSYGALEMNAENLTLADYQQMKSWGFNSVSSGLKIGRLFQTDSANWKSKFDKVKQNIEYANQAGLKFLLGPGTSEPQYTDWFKHDDLFKPEYQELFYQIHEAIYRNITSKYPNVIQVILYVPFHQEDANESHYELYEKIIVPNTIQRLRNIGYKGSIGIVWMHADSDVKDLTNDTNVFYIYHNYQPMEVTHQNGTYYGNKEALRERDLKAYNFRETTGKNVLCNEWGVSWRASGTLREDQLNWVRDMKSVHEEYSIPNTYWDYGYVDDFGVLNADKTPTPIVDIIKQS